MLSYILRGKGQARYDVKCVYYRGREGFNVLSKNLKGRKLDRYDRMWWRLISLFNVHLKHVYDILIIKKKMKVREVESGRQDLLELRIKNGNSCTCVYVGRPRSVQKIALTVKISIQLLGFLEIKIWERETIHGCFKQLH